MMKFAETSPLALEYPILLCCRANPLCGFTPRSIEPMDHFRLARNYMLRPMLDPSRHSLVHLICI